MLPRKHRLTLQYVCVYFIYYETLIFYNEILGYFNQYSRWMHCQTWSQVTVPQLGTCRMVNSSMWVRTHHFVDPFFLRKAVAVPQSSTGFLQNPKKERDE